MDIRIPLACVLIVGGAVGLFLPGDDRLRTYDRPASMDAPLDDGDEAQLAVAQEAASAGWNEPVTLYRESDGHFYAEVQVDGRYFRMLVDTGASVVALTGDDAAAMGIYWNQDDIQHVAQGANGPVEGVVTTIDRMALGGHETGQVRAIIIPEGAGVSLLGQSFLSTLGKVEIVDDRMILGS